MACRSKTETHYGNSNERFRSPALEDAPVGPIFSGFGRAGTSIPVNASAGNKANAGSLALLLFVLGVAFLSYMYGVASSRFSLFPYEMVSDAWVAGKALREAIAAEFDDMPPGALAFETGPTL